MDNTKEFILQCEKAVEIQNSDKIHILEPGDYMAKVVDGKVDSIILIHKDFRQPLFFCDIWLPRQDQLQGMVTYQPKDEQTWIWKRMADFTCFWKNGKESYILLFNSMEQLWLAFVMKEKFNKIWDGNDWRKN